MAGSISRETRTDVEEAFLVEFERIRVTETLWKALGG